MSQQQLITDDRQAFARAWLFRHGTPLQLGPPWSFVPVCDHIRGPIRARRRVLASIREQFADQTLLRAGLAERPPGGDLRLATVLTRREGAVMALQSGAEERPWDLLSGGGLLSGIGHPVLSALQDYRVRDRARELGVVVAAGHIRSVALLTALGLPATLGAGLNRLTLDEMRRLNDEYGEGLPHFEFAPDAEPDGVSDEETASPAEETGVERGSIANNNEQVVAHDVEIEVPPSPPALLLTDWDPFEICSAPQSWTRHAAVRLAEGRRSAGLPLGGVFVWRPHPAMLDRLRFAANSQDFELAQAALVDSLDAVEDFETVLADRQLESRSAHNERRSAAARLGVQAVDPLGGDAADRESANQERAAAIEEELLAPLREFALTRSNPVVRNTVVLMSDVAQLLYLLGPQVQDALGRSLTSAAPCDSTRGTLNQYLSLVDRFGRLCGALRAWSR